MKFTIFVLGIIILALIGFIMSSDSKKYSHSNEEQLVNSILSKAAKIITDKFDLKPCGVGVAMPGGRIQEVTLCFNTKYPHTKEQLRKLLINSSVELLNQMNENKEIQEFLNEKPFSIKNIEIIIYNHDEKGYGLKDPQISVANVSQGELNYSTIDPEDSFKYKNEYEETYEEALKAVSSP